MSNQLQFLTKEEVYTKYGIPQEKEEQKKWTPFEKISFCFKYDIKTDNDFKKIFFCLNEILYDMFFSYVIDSPKHWFYELTVENIVQLEHEFPNKFTKAFYEGKPFYFKWLMIQGKYDDGNEQVQQHDWTIITEDALYAILNNINNTKKDNTFQMIPIFGIFLYFMSLVDVKSNEYIEMENKPFLIKGRSCSENGKTNPFHGNCVLKIAAKLLPTDMFFSLLEKYNFKGDSKLYKIFFEKKLEFSELFTIYKRLHKNYVELDINMNQNYVIEMFDQPDNFFKLIQWLSCKRTEDGYIKYGFASMCKKLGDRLFDENIPDKSISWMAWFLKNGFLNKGYFRINNMIFIHYYKNIDECLIELPKSHKLEYRLIEYLIYDDYESIENVYNFVDNIIDILVTKFDIKSIMLLHKNGYKVKNITNTWRNVMEVITQFPSLNDKYKSKLDEQEKQEYSDKIAILCLPTIKWLYETYPFTYEQFDDMFNSFQKDRMVECIYNYLYKMNENVRCYNDDHDKYCNVRHAKFTLKLHLPKERKKYIKHERELQLLLKEEKRLSGKIEEYDIDDFNEVVYRTPRELPEYNDLGTIDEWKTVHRDNNRNSRNNRNNRNNINNINNINNENDRNNINNENDINNINNRNEDRFKEEYDMEMKRRDELKKEYENRIRINNNIDEINDNVKDLKVLRLNKIEPLKENIRKIVYNIYGYKNRIREAGLKVDDKLEKDGKISETYNNNYDDYDDYYSSHREERDKMSKYDFYDHENISSYRYGYYDHDNYFDDDSFY
jgi:hypothetical protein